MKPENHQDIIKQMAERLREHSAPYKEGAWDRFQEAEKKRSGRIVLWPYISAAAAVLIAVVLFLLPQKEKFEVEQLADHKVEVRQIDKEIKTEERVDDVEALLTDERDKKETIVVASKSSVIDENINEKRALQATQQQIAHIEPIPTSEYVNIEAVEPVVETVAANQGLIEPETALEPVLLSSITASKDNFGGFLERLSEGDEDDRVILNKNTDKKWSIGLDISPTISNNKQVNMGGGIAFAYSVSSKVSFSSGVSYLQLGTERGPNIPPVMHSPAEKPKPGEGFPVAAFPTERVNVKTLNKVAANLIGLDIPLAINYHVNKNLYASVGISVFNVFNEDRVNQFLNQEVNVLSSVEGEKSPKPMVQTFYSSERATEKEYEGQGVSGFYNFSIGYSIPVSKKVGLSIEPFFKIPMNTFREDDMNLSNGGLKISTRF